MKKIIFVLLSIFAFGNFYSNNYTLVEKTNDIYKNESNNHKETYNNFMEAYYDNLVDNYGYNAKGSCGYIALSMLLSYYDNYISDNIIDEKYDVSINNSTNDFISNRISPGTKSEENYHIDINNYKTYYDYIEDTKNFNFHTYLISLGIDLGINKKNDDDYGTLLKDREKVLKTYLDIRGINYTIVSKEKNLFTNSVRNFVIDNIKQGYPVLIGVKNETYAHACIAYEYDEAEDKIYCHLGDKKILELQLKNIHSQLTEVLWF